VKTDSTFLGIGAAAAAMAVALGALGAHALRARLEPAALAAYQTAVQYHSLHSLALCIVALWLMRLQGGDTGRRHATVAAWSFCVGIVLFSGSLYALVLGGPRWLGPVTPAGGVAFIVGWSALAIGAFRHAAR
jgi:uncharacterized membrane protein YgdD (TMEM256/DUF423 family)